MLLLFAELAVMLTHNVNQCRNELIDNRLFVSEQAAMARGAPEDTAQNVSPTFIGQAAAVRKGKR